MGDAHQVIIDDIGKVISRQAVLLDQHVVIKRRAFRLNMAEEKVVKGGDSLCRDVLADHAGFAGLHSAPGFLARDAEAVLVILKCFSPRGGSLTPLLQLLLGAKAGIGVSGFYQLEGIGQIHVLALGLDIGAVFAADIRAFIIIQSCRAQRIINQLHSARHFTLLISVFNAKDELAPVFTGKQIGE